MDDHQEIVDEFRGIKIWWFCSKYVTKTSTSFYPIPDERRYFQLTFHAKNREFVSGDYLEYVMKEGRAIKARNRQRRLYTNSGPYWLNIMFNNPATFETLAMELDKKGEKIEDLVGFSKSGEVYANNGQAWKHGYLLYGLPETGKSTMIVAMANLLEYDLYDLELTAVNDNTELRRLLIETSSKSVIVIEDIDCSLNITRERKKMVVESGCKHLIFTVGRIPDKLRWLQLIIEKGRLRRTQLILLKLDIPITSYGLGTIRQRAQRGKMSKSELYDFYIEPTTLKFRA